MINLGRGTKTGEAAGVGVKLAAGSLFFFSFFFNYMNSPETDVT